ncbi:hypothetical protein BGZ63DRAFT_396038 [Mariannaea sp. PMI_226]|nr:hypothetical protein BGZ63DRAFT_396038 [Mariannaea sp. PMI_226]
MLHPHSSQKKSDNEMKIVHILALVFLAVVSSLWLIFPAGDYPREYDTPEGAPQRPGIGISLTASYGTISIRHVNGSIHNIGRIDGSDQYISLMKRLSNPEKRHPSPPYSSLEEQSDDYPRQIIRSIRKRLWLPASPDVGILAEMLRPLLKLYSNGERVRSAVISYPPIVALYHEDIVDAAAYLNVRFQNGAHRYQPREVVAAFAGHGRGLCDHPDDQDVCWDEVHALPWIRVLLVEYTKKAMLLHIYWLQGAVDLAYSYIDALALFDMGSERRHEPGFLLKLQGYIQELVDTKYPNPPEVSEMLIIMTGDEEDVGDTEVKDTIRHTVENIGFPLVRMMDSIPEYVAAQGAAEFCWRGTFYHLNLPGSL